MDDLLKQLAKFDLDTKFLMDFAYKTFLEALVWLAFTARKFPKASQVGTLWTLRDEKFLPVENQPSGNVNRLSDQYFYR